MILIGLPEVLFGVFIAGLVWVAAAPKNMAYASRVGRYTGETGLTAAEGLRESWRLPRTVEIFLARAGADWSPTKALAILVAHLVAGLMLGIFLGMPPIGVAFGALALYGRLRIGQVRRLQKLAAQLPEALMLMASAIRSGLGFQQAIKLVAEDGAQPIANEMRRFAQDLAMGLTMAEALARLQTRFGSTDAEMLASALMIQHQTGGNLTEILLNLHQSIRERQQVQGQVRTLTAQGKMSGIVLTVLPFVIALAIHLLNPNYMMVFLTEPRGQFLFAFGTLSMLVGAYAIHRIVDIRL